MNYWLVLYCVLPSLSQTKFVGPARMSFLFVRKLDCGLVPALICAIHTCFESLFDPHELPGCPFYLLES